VGARRKNGDPFKSPAKRQYLNVRVRKAGTPVGQLGKLRADCQSANCRACTGQRRLPTAAQAASLPHITPAIHFYVAHPWGETREMESM